MNDDLIGQLTHELGKILQWEEECPGVYYIGVLPDDGAGQEYYLALENAPISQEVRAMGRPLETVAALVYPMDAEEGVRHAVEYEILKYKIAHDLPMPEGASLRETALYGMEMCPGYFGTYPVPPLTPWGYTLRHRPLDAGIFWIETDQCAQVLAVCHPVWATELSAGILKIAHKLELEDEMGYLFFKEESACVALWEFLLARPELADIGLIRRAELMNAIWEYQPEYAMGWNAQEQSGLGDGMDLLLYALGIEDRESDSSPQNMIAMTEGAGIDFLGFWK